MNTTRRALVCAALVGCCTTPQLNAQDDTVWAEVESAVRGELATRWAIIPDQVVLEWGPYGSLEFTGDPVTPELVGNGRGGQWVVRVESTRGVVGVRLRAGVMSDTPVAAHPLDRGTSLSITDIRYERRTVWGPPTERAQPNADHLVGRVAQRRVAEGEALVPPAVVEPPVVRSGETVEVSWSTGAIRLSLMGRAMRSARAGERLSVRLETGKRVQGVATPEGSVLVSGPSR